VCSTCPKQLKRFTAVSAVFVYCFSSVVRPVEQRPVEHALNGSGAGTNLKVKKKFLSCLFTFFCCTSTISRSGEHFREGQYSLVSFFFAVLLLTVPPPRTQPCLKVGERASRALWSRRHTPLLNGTVQ